MTNVGRRAFLARATAGAAVLGFPAVLRAQAPTVKLGLIHPVTGPLAEDGQACRLGAQLAAEHINAAGGIKSLGGAKLEVLLGDTQSKPDVARTEAERLINAGAQILQGPFSSGDAAAIVPVVQQRRVPFLVDIAAADPITANVAKAVKDGQQKVQYVYRNFPTGSSFGRRAVQYFNENLQGGWRRAEARGADAHQRPLRPEPGPAASWPPTRRRRPRGRSWTSSRGRSRRRTCPPRWRGPGRSSPTSSRPSPGRPAPSSCCPSWPSSGSRSSAS